MSAVEEDQEFLEMEAQVAEPDSGFMLVTCPEGMGPGMMLLVTTAIGVELEVEVPDGVTEGEEFEVFVGGVQANNAAGTESGGEATVEPPDELAMAFDEVGDPAGPRPETVPTPEPNSNGSCGNAALTAKLASTQSELKLSSGQYSPEPEEDRAEEDEEASSLPHFMERRNGTGIIGPNAPSFQSSGNSAGNTERPRRFTEMFNDMEAEMAAMMAAGTWLSVLEQLTEFLWLLFSCELKYVGLRRRGCGSRATDRGDAYGAGVCDCSKRVPCACDLGATLHL